MYVKVILSLKKISLQIKVVFFIVFLFLTYLYPGEKTMEKIKIEFKITEYAGGRGVDIPAGANAASSYHINCSIMETGDIFVDRVKRDKLKPDDLKKIHDIAIEIAKQKNRKKVPRNLNVNMNLVVFINYKNQETVESISVEKKIPEPMAEFIDLLSSYKEFSNLISPSP